MHLEWQMKSPTKEDIKALPKWSIGSSRAEGREDPAKGFVVYSYSKAGFMKSWEDPAAFWDWPMCECRGLVYNWDGQLISRSFPKFHNLNDSYLGDWKPEYDHLNITMVPKFDGAMLVGFVHPEHGLRFHSKQGIGHEFEEWAQREFAAGRIHGVSDEELKTLKTYGMSSRTSYVFELIVPEDEHVVPMIEQGLYYLGAVDLERDVYIPNIDGYGDDVLHYDNINEAMQAYDDVEDFEGYVMILHKDGVIHNILKMKSDWYMQRRTAMKILEKKTNDRVLWKQFKVRGNGIVYDSAYAMKILEDYYDDWQADNHELIQKLEAQLTKTYEESREVVMQATAEDWSRKELVEYVSKKNMVLPAVMAVYDASDSKLEDYCNGKHVWNTVENNRKKSNTAITDGDT